MQSTVSTVLITQEHAIICDIETRGLRLLDIFNDNGSEFLTIKNARVTRRDDQRVVSESESAAIRKSNVGVIYPNTATHESPRRRRENYAEKRSFDIFMLVFGCEIFGEMQLSGCDDPVSVLAGEMGDFIPVPNAEIRHPSAALVATYEAKVAIINNQAVSLLRIGNDAQERDENELLAAIRGIVEF
jgi:hypothetical protein